jgi:hypothetical protein
MTHFEKLDFILHYLYNNKAYISSISLFEKLTPKIDNTEVTLIINSLTENGYLEKIISTNKNACKIQPTYTVRITYQGMLFFDLGGFKNENETLKLNKRWKVAKISAAVANAAIIIFISIWAIRESKKEPKTVKLEKEIELLKKKVEKMNFIKNDTLKINNLN